MRISEKIKIDNRYVLKIDYGKNCQVIWQNFKRRVQIWSLINKYSKKRVLQQFRVGSQFNGFIYTLRWVWNSTIVLCIKSIELNSLIFPFKTACKTSLVSDIFLSVRVIRVVGEVMLCWWRCVFQDYSLEAKRYKVYNFQIFPSLYGRAANRPRADQLFWADRLNI